MIILLLRGSSIVILNYELTYPQKHFSIRIGSLRDWNSSYPFSMVVVGERQGLRTGRPLLWRFFFIDKSRTPSVIKECEKRKSIWFNVKFRLVYHQSIGFILNEQLGYRCFKFTLPWSLGAVGGLLIVRSRGASWSAMSSLLRTGFWLCAGPATVATGLEDAGAPESEGEFGRLWSEGGWKSERLSWGGLVFEVYSAANCRIILWRISRATTGMCGSEKFGTSEETKSCNLMQIYECSQLPNIFVVWKCFSAFPEP